MNRKFMNYLKSPSLVLEKICEKRMLKKLQKENPFEYRAIQLRYHGVKIGENSRVSKSVVFADHVLIEIGDNVTIAGETKLLTHDASPLIFAKNNEEKNFIYGRIIIGNNVFIGFSSIILPGVTIGNDVIIGAGSVVRKDVPSGFLVMGNPAKIVMKTSVVKKLIFSHKNLLINNLYMSKEINDKMLIDHFKLNERCFDENFYLNHYFCDL